VVVVVMDHLVNNISASEINFSLAEHIDKGIYP
jgi:hypothetical protein